jgi:hypothetical protein
MDTHGWIFLNHHQSGGMTGTTLDGLTQKSIASGNLA